MIESSPFEQSNLENRQSECIRRLQDYQKDFDIWGHGVTSPEIAEQILQEGLRTRWKALHDISYQLPENPDLLLHKLKGWDYNARKFIVLIAVPKGFSSTDYGGYQSRQNSIQSSNQHVFSPLPDSKNMINSRKIIGYIDVHSFDFVDNPDFHKRQIT